QIPAGTGRWAQADVTDRIEPAFVRQHAVGERDLVADLGEIIGHGRFLLFDWAAGWFQCRRSKAEMPAIAKPCPGPGAAQHARMAAARVERKDCLAKAPRCQQIARMPASKSENDP